MTISKQRRGGEASPRRAATRALLGLAGIACLVAAYVFLAPSKLHGSTDYVTTYGVSMQPKFHAGDLIAVRARSSYRVGQIVAYDNRELGRVVLHRIIGRNGDRFVFKGDNNNFVDSYEPTRNDLIGRLWWRVPQGGRVVAWIQTPRHTAVVGAGAAVLGLLLGGSATRRRRRRRNAGAVRPARGRVAWAQPVAGAALVALLAAGAVFGLAERAPTTRMLSVPGYSQQGTYSYGAEVPAGPVYPSGRIGTGQTVFTKLARSVRIGFGYRFLSSLPHSLHGTAQLRLALRSSLGWTLPLPSPAGRPVDGDSVQLDQILDLAAVERRVALYLAHTGVASDSFTLTVTPHVDLHGTVDGQDVGPTFSPTPLTFIVDPTTLRLAQPALGSTAPGTPAGDPLHPSAAGTTTSVVPRTLGIAGRSLPVLSLRRDALLAVFGAAILLVIALAAAGLGRSADEAARIRRLHRETLVAVAAPPAPSGAGYADVESFDDLLRIAGYYERPILVSREGGVERFHVTDGDTVYRYTACAGAAATGEAARHACKLWAISERAR